MRYKPGFKVRRAFDSEKQLLKRTARSLATRFDTRPRWIEEILNSTIFKNLPLVDYKPEYKGNDSILSDSDLRKCFSPNLIEALTAIGAVETITLFQVDSSKLDALDYGEYTRAGSDQRILEKKEVRQHQLIRDNIGLYKVLIEAVPPPLGLSNQDEDDDEWLDSDSDLVDLLRAFSSHLETQREAMVHFTGKAEAPFNDFPWFDLAFSTGAPVNRVGLDRKNKLGVTREPSKPEKKFISSIVNNGSHGYQDRKSRFLGKPIEHIRNREVLVREMLFELRIQVIKIIADYLEGAPSREPVDAVANLIADRFSREQFRALVGELPEYFYLPSEKKYRHANHSIFHRLLRASTILPAVYDSRIVRLFYKTSDPLYRFSVKIKEPHILKLGYFDAVKLLGTQKADSVASAFHEIYEKFNSLEVRAIDVLNGLFRTDASSQADSKTQNSLNSITEDLSQRSNVVIPYLKELLSPEVGKETSQKVGAFFDNFREFRPYNKKLAPIKFTKTQALVMEALFNARSEYADGCLKRLTLVDKIYSIEDARAIRSKDGTKVIKTNKKLSKLPYEWRLEKTILKNSHPAWRMGLVEHGDKIGDEKTYRLNLDFETNSKK